MQTLWKLSQDGNSASRTLDNGSFESRLVGSIPAEELATALPADPIPIPTYKELRAAKHIPMQDQLDMIYWDKVNGTNKFEEYCAAIKAEFPKP